MSGAALFGLLHPGQITQIGQHRAHLIAQMAVDDVNARRMQRPRGVEHMRQQRASCERHQDLWFGGLHPLALAGGENDHMQGGARHIDSQGGVGRPF